MPVTIPAEDIAARIAQLEAKKARRTKQAAATPTPVPKTDVDRCDHLSVRSVLYHSAWSGEFDTFRNGVLTHGQAWGIVCMALLLPCLGGGGTMLVMFSMVKMLTSGNFRTDAVACVVSTLLKWPMLQSISEEHQIWQQFGGEQWQAVWIIFVLETTAVLAWAHVPMSSGGDRWQLDHATKFAVMLGLFAMLHNPIASEIWKPMALEMMGFTLKK